MNAHVNPFRAYIDATLERLGGLYLYEDIVEAVKNGTMQGHVVGDSWAVTQVTDTPRKRVLNIIFVAGRLKDMVELDAEVERWARENHVDIMMGTPRREWENLIRKPGKFRDTGWEHKTSLFMKELR